jgi:hypothetical protein
MAVQGQLGQKVSETSMPANKSSVVVHTLIPATQGATGKEKHGPKLITSKHVRPYQKK